MRRLPWPAEVGDHVIELAADETIACPCSHRRVIVGPGVVRVRRWRDGGLDMDHGDLAEIIDEA